MQEQEGGNVQYYLAIDIGASSGRHILSHQENGKIVLEEVHRFPNGMTDRNGHKVWDWKRLLQEIILGMKKCKELGKIPVSVGIDTWAVDFALLDEHDQIIGETVAYRDDRTQGIDQEVYKTISPLELYQRTGIQKQIFNTIYQLSALKEQHPEQLEKAKTFLMLPDYFAFLLTGKKASEYTNATTTQLVSPKTNTWDFELIERLGLPKQIFMDLCMPGTKLGGLLPEIQQQVGYDCDVVVVATHDTASAVMAVPSNQEDALYISSGTWSLMGTELLQANCSERSMQCNLTNEGGYAHRFRYLKNIMGMWMINSAKNELAKEMSFSELCEKAEACSIQSLVPVDDQRFLAPQSMVQEIQNACQESGQQVPDGIVEVAAVIYRSLAVCYADTAKEIEDLTGKRYDCIHIVGGGCNADYLNRLTAQFSKKTVYAGPVEASAIGNIVAQMISAGKFTGLSDARACIFDSFSVKTYKS